MGAAVRLQEWALPQSTSQGPGVSSLVLGRWGRCSALAPRSHSPVQAALLLLFISQQNSCSASPCATHGPPGPVPRHCSPTRDQAEGTPCSSSSSGTSGQLFLKIAGISSLRTGTSALSSAKCPGPGTVPATPQALSTHYHLHLEDEKAKRIPQASIWRDGDSEGGVTWHIVQPQNTTIHKQDTWERHRRRPWGLKNFTEDLLCARH